MHTLKELEKALPSIASINGMQVKEFITGLQNENMITVEKIGSGNWYWSFASDELKSRETTLASLRETEAKLAASVETMNEQLGKFAMSEEEKQEHQQLMAELDVEKAEVVALEAELDGFRDGDPEVLGSRKRDAEKIKALAMRATDNIYVLEQTVKQMVGGDHEQLENLKRDMYGEEYVEGEGLKEWAM